LAKLMTSLRKGDVMLVTRLDRLGRSVRVLDGLLPAAATPPALSFRDGTLLAGFRQLCCQPPRTIAAT